MYSSSAILGTPTLPRSVLIESAYTGPRRGKTNGDENALLADLLERVSGDPKVFAELYDRTSARVYGLVLRVLRDPGYAEETTQEVYLQIWRGAGNFDSAKGSAMSWMLTLAHRRAIDRVRSEQSSTNRELAHGLPQREFDEVSDNVLARFERRDVQNCLKSLTETQSQAIALAYYGGKTYREVAETLQSPVPTIKSRIRDGLLRLKNCLGVN